MRMNSTGHLRRTRTRDKSVPTNVTLDASLVAEARELGVNISQASAAGLERAVANARAERWLEENRSALQASNAYVEAHGLPLKSMRRF
jgi:antitoxin CcdA